MATTDSAATLHAKVLPYLLKHAYQIKKKDLRSSPIAQMIEDGAIAAETVYEMFEAKQFGGQKESRDGYDIYYIDELGNKILLEVKLRSLGSKNYSWGIQRTAQLSKKETKNKCGDIIMGVYNPFRETLDRFYLPIGVGFTPGNYVTVSYSLKKDNYNTMEKYLISSTALG